MTVVRSDHWAMCRLTFRSAGDNRSSICGTAELLRNLHARLGSAIGKGLLESKAPQQIVIPVARQILARIVKNQKTFYFVLVIV